MILRRTSPAPQKRNTRAPAALLAVALALLLACGCTSPQPSGSPDQTIVPTADQSVSPAPPADNSCRPVENRTPYIIINPVSDHHIGDVFEINGTTNLGTDKKIHFFIFRSYQPGEIQPRVPYPYSSGLVKFCNDNSESCDTNKSCISANLSGANPAQYRVIVGNLTMSNETVFRVD